MSEVAVALDNPVDQVDEAADEASILDGEEAETDKGLVEEEESAEEEEDEDIPEDEELPPDGEDVGEEELVKEMFPGAEDIFFGEALPKDDPRLMLIQAIPALTDQDMKSPCSLSQHSEDSSSSKEESKKEGEDQEDAKFMELEEKCLIGLREIPEVPTKLIGDIDIIFRKYHEHLEREKKAKIKAEAELVYKAQKMIKDLQNANELQAQVTLFKQNLEQKEEEIAKLKAELDESHRRQQDLTDEKKTLFKKIEQLDRDLDKRQLEDQMKDSSADVKGKTRESYIKEIGRLKRELDILEGRLFQSQSDREALEKKLLNKEKEYAEMEELVKGQKYEVMKHEQRKKVVEKDLERALISMTELKKSVGRHYETFKKAVLELTHLDNENFELKKAVMGLEDQNTIMSKYIIELRDRLEYLSKAFFEQKEQNDKLKSLCTNQTGNLEIIQKKSVDIEKYIERWSSRLAFVDRKRKAALEEVKKLSHDLMLKRKEGQQSELVMVKLNKRINELQNEKNLFSQQIKKISDLLAAQKENSQIQFKVIEELSEESDKLKLEMEKSEKKIQEWMLLKNVEETEKKEVLYQNELLSAELQVSLKKLQMLQSELNKKGKDVKTVIEDYNNLLSDRKSLQRRLLETQGITKDYEFKINQLYAEIENFKQIIRLKDDINEKLRHKIKRLEFDYNHLDDKARHGRLDITSLKNAIKEKVQEKNMLNALLQRGETIRLVLMRDVDRLRQDVTILRTTIQRRNADIALRDEKVELMNVVVKTGDNEYKQRLADIGLLKTEVSKLRAEKKMLIKTLENNGNLRNEIFLLQKELTQEKQKSRALEEQMESPINVHRWRILEGKDPEKHELIKKTQLLQKKLFQSEEKYSMLEEQLTHLQVMNNNLKNYLEKIPGGPECAQNLFEAKRLLRNKTSENQRLAAEAAANSNEVSLLKKKVEEAKKDVDEMKKKYFELKLKMDHECRRKSSGSADLIKQLPPKSPSKNVL